MNLVKKKKKIIKKIQKSILSFSKQLIFYFRRERLFII